MRIGIDLMGSDHSPIALFDAIIQTAKQSPSIQLVVFATREAGAAMVQLYTQLSTLSALGSVEFEWVDQVITMRDDPIPAIRLKKKSSIVLGIKMLKRGAIDAFISAGNTGALIASAAIHLPKLPGISRPGLLTLMPTEREPMAVMDVGGMHQCKAAHLVNFSRVGAAFLRIFQGIALPRVALLNIGSESKKGSHEHQMAYRLLEEGAERDRFNFTGNVEGRDVFQGKVDLLVTDGFTGNVLLKTAEGVALFILDFLKSNSLQTGSGFVQHLIQELQGRFSYAEYPGAILLGVEGVVVKCHGDSSARALYHAIQASSAYVERGLISKISKELAEHSAT